MGNTPVGSSITATETSAPWLSTSPLASNSSQTAAASSCSPFGSLPSPTEPSPGLIGAATLSHVTPSYASTPQTASCSATLRAGHCSPPLANLVLLRRSDSVVVWQNFDHPADTILPTQAIEIGGQLVSWISQTNFSQGRFYAAMSESGDFVFNTKSVPSNTAFDAEYYDTRLSDQSASNPGYRVVFDERGSISVVRRNGGQDTLTPVRSHRFRTIITDPLLISMAFSRNTIFPGTPTAVPGGFLPDPGPITSVLVLPARPAVGHVAITASAG